MFACVRFEDTETGESNKIGVDATSEGHLRILNRRPLGGCTQPNQTGDMRQILQPRIRVGTQPSKNWSVSQREYAP